MESSKEAIPALILLLLKENMKESNYITNSRAAEAIIHDKMQTLDHEEVWAIFLDRRARVIEMQMLSKGTLSQTSIDCRTVLRNALLVNAASVILLHNHPSGDPRPSVQDVNFTAKLKRACSLLDVLLVDHIVLGEESFYSFADDTTTNYQ